MHFGVPYAISVWNLYEIKMLPGTGMTWLYNMQVLSGIFKPIGTFVQKIPGNSHAMDIFWISYECSN